MEGVIKTIMEENDSEHISVAVQNEAPSVLSECMDEIIHDLSCVPLNLEEIVRVVPRLISHVRDLAVSAENKRELVIDGALSLVDRLVGEGDERDLLRAAVSGALPVLIDIVETAVPAAPVATAAQGCFGFLVQLFRKQQKE